jgi:pimeloyl-ACP methyl ester carboxylesterase
MKNALLLAFAILSLLSSSFKTDDVLGKFVPADCPLKLPEALVKSGKFSFGYMKVPEFHKNPDGKAIELALAIFKCQADSATHEPLIFVTGGPGSSDIGGWLPILSGDLGKLFLSNRDVVIIELRGLKYSKPNLICPELDNLKLYLLDKNFTAEKTVDLYLDTLKRVYNRFEREGVNLSAYNNDEIADDIVYVMDNLGYKKFSMFGVSFGTSVVETLLLRHPDHLVCVVLNAVVNLNKSFTNMHINSINTLDSIFEKCKRDQELDKAYPDLKNRFLALVKELNEKPVLLKAKYPDDGKVYDVVLNGDKLSAWLFASMYYNTQVPLTLHKILSGDYSQITNDPGFLFPLKDFSIGMSLCVILSGYSNFTSQSIPMNGAYADFVKGCGTMFFTPYFLSKAKKVWKVADLTNEDKTIHSDVPTLMFCGELDHVCPPADVEEFSKNLKNAYLYIFQGIAHSPIEYGICGIMMMKEFIDNPSKPPNSDCVKEFHSGFKLPESAAR